MTLTETPLVYALGLTLFHFLWQGCLIALALAAGLYIFQPLSARVRYGLACAAMLSMLISFGSTLALAWPHSDGAYFVAGPKTRYGLFAPVPPSAPEQAPPAEESRLQRLVPFWILGVGLFGLRSLVNWTAARRLRNIGVCAAAEHWQERLTQLAKRIHVSRPVVLLESCLTEVPAVIGFLRPVILIPLGLLAGFPPEQIELILIHELAHIRRYDYIINLLQSLTEDLLFYHPAVWWVSALVRTERENCCDDVVVGVKGDARGLAAALTALEHYRWTARESTLAANGGHLMNRIRRLLEGKQGPRATAPVCFAALLVASLGLATTISSKPAPVPPPADPPKLLAQAAAQPPAPLVQDAQIPGPYRNWLNEDVVYIISDEERSAFRKLLSDEQRQAFIQQFWLRRDPTPTTPENEAMEEHYRRIGFANEHFSASGFPGWKTDRGRIYIVFGPPDEIDSHPAPEQGGAITTTFPFENWRYRYIQGIGNNVNMEFVDTTLTGEYHMTKDPNVKDR
jgi:GWxTD domain-containing protein